MGVQYAGKVAIRKAVETARALGIEVAGFELAPDGTIRIMGPRGAEPSKDDLFAELERQGKL